MELVYLWIEEYKNIKRQGFNFSPRFECKFHDKYDKNGKLEDNCELEIIDKKETGEEYLKDFFGDNINVTAIVGKNGSGKSRILKSLRLLIDKKKVGLILYYNNKDKKFIYQKNSIEEIDINNSNSLTKIDYSHEKNIFFPLFDYSLTYDPLIKNNELNPTYPDKDKGAIIFSKELIKNQKNIINNYYDLNEKKQLDKFEKFFQPKKILITIDFSTFKEYKKKLNAESERKYTQLYKNIYKNTIQNIRNIFNLFKESSSYTPSRLPKMRPIEIIFDMTGSNSEEEELNNIWSDNFKKEKALNTIFDKNELDKIEEIDNRDILTENTTYKLFLLNINDLTKDDIDIIMTSFASEHFFKIELIDKNQKKLSDLSFGEQQLLFILNQLYSLGIQKSIEMSDSVEQPPEIINIDNYIVLLDEIDIGFHPDWQKRTIQYIIDFLKLTPNKKFHLVFTTHSPFLLSDIPKGNIIFLNDNSSLKQTFGANIHTLLSNSFFMDNGLIGEFAQNKIQNVINFLKDEKSEINSANEAKKIIDIIGEPFLKMQIEDLYKKKFPETLKLDKQIEKLKQELKRLENAKNRN